MSQVTKTEAIVLKKKQLLQKDTLITLLTEENGKVTVIAKGIKTITSRRAPHIQTGNLLNVILSDRGHAFFLQQTELISAFSAIREHNEKMNYLYTFLFILDKMLPEGQEEKQIYNITKSFLVNLAKTPPSLSQFFHQEVEKVLFALGYSQGHQPLSEIIRTIEEIINEKVPFHAII